jgi:signal transduction histidine kinase
MLDVMRSALRHHRELILAATFAVMAAWEVLEILLLERAYHASMPRTLVIHSLQVLLIVAATAIALRAWREKAERQRALASLVEQVISAQDHERRRVAYDVHDGVAQLVVSAKQHLDTAADLWPRDAQRAASETAIAADRLGRAIAETRRILAALRPLAVDAGGLAGAARQSLDEIARDTGWSVELVENLGAARLPPAVETAAFRILQEALSNARQHAGTTRIEVVLSRDTDRVDLDVRDYGVGLAAAAGARGLGLPSMRERARLLGGTCVVETADGGGTHIHAQLPLNYGLVAPAS